MYFLYLQEEVVYIGKSDTSVKLRIIAHTKSKNFDKVKIYSNIPEQDLGILELYAIGLHSPIYNKDCNSEKKPTCKISNYAQLLRKVQVFNKEVH